MESEDHKKLNLLGIIMRNMESLYILQMNLYGLKIINSCFINLL